MILLLGILRNLAVGTLCFCLYFFVHVVNVRIAAKLIFFSINVYLDMAGSSNKHQEFASQYARDSREVFHGTQPHSSPRELVVQEVGVIDVVSGSDVDATTCNNHAGVVIGELGVIDVASNVDMTHLSLVCFFC
jgi:hypothetical protein